MPAKVVPPGLKTTITTVNCNNLKVYYFVLVGHQQDKQTIMQLKEMPESKIMQT